jgi:hypothetical protein
VYFRDRVSWTICLGWLRTTILISASKVARITSMSPSAQLACIFTCVFYRGGGVSISMTTTIEYSFLREELIFIFCLLLDHWDNKSQRGFYVISYTQKSPTI